MSRKLASNSETTTTAPSFTQLGLPTYVFMVISALFGVLLVIWGIKTAQLDKDWLLATMVLIIPGGLFVLDSFIYTRWHSYRSAVSFVSVNALLVLFIGFLAECIYFQFIYFGINQPQYKMAIPALLIMAVVAVLMCILTGIFAVVQRKTGR